MQNDDADGTAGGAPRVPKYKAPDFMRKEMALFAQARTATMLIRRYGDTDTPIQPIAPLAAVRAVRPPRAIPGIDATER